MADGITAYPLCWPVGWPRTKASHRRDARNRWGRGEGNKRRPWTFSEARDELLNEIDRFGATGVVVSSDFRLTQTGLPSRNFGVPYDQGVAIYFTLKGKPMVMAQDGNTRAEENLRALALVLKYLRGVEELGGATMMEKTFEGFTALPAPRAPRTWRQVFGFGPGAAVAAGDIERRYRDLAKKAHPDTPGGSHDAFTELQRAKEEAMKEINNG